MTASVDRELQHCRPGDAGGRPVVFSLGSNMGDRLGHLQLAVDVLVSGGLTDAVVSSVYETDPVGGPEQDDYLNAALLGVSCRSARELLGLAVAAETRAGRVRSVRFGPRTLDVDIIVSGDETSTDPELTLPHPRAHERAFVLAPMLELNPDAVLPGQGSVADLLAAIGTQGIRRRKDLALTIPVGAGGEAVTRCT